MNFLENLARKARERASQVYDQANMLDGGRTYQQRTATRPQASAVQQIQRSGVSNAVGGVVKPLVRSSMALNQGIGNAQVGVYNMFAKNNKPMLTGQQFADDSIGRNANRAIDYTGTKRQITGDVISNVANVGFPGSSKLVTNAAKTLVPQKAPQIIQNFAPKIAGGASVGAVSGGVGNVGTYVGSNEPLSLKGVANEAKTGAMYGAAFGGALPVAIPAAQLAAKGTVKSAKFADKQVRTANDNQAAVANYDMSIKRIEKQIAAKQKGIDNTTNFRGVETNRRHIDMLEAEKANMIANRPKLSLKDKVLAPNIGLTVGGPNALQYMYAKKQGRVFDGVDGKPRFEIDDSGAKFKSHDLTNGSFAGDILDHPELYKNYPGMKDVPIEIDRNLKGNAALDDRTGTLKINPRLTEQIQSAKADLSKIKRSDVEVHLRSIGYTQKQIKAETGNLSLEDLIKNSLTQEEINKLARLENPQHQLRLKEDAKGTLLHELQHEIQSRERFTAGGSPKDSSGKAIEQYRNLAGEAEARAVQARMNMTDGERYVTPNGDSYYHGTNQKYDDFDLSKANAGGLYGKSAYLTKDLNRAKSYGDNVNNLKVPKDAKLLTPKEFEKRVSALTSTVPYGDPTLARTKAIDQLIKEGWDGVREVNKQNGDTVAIFNPKKLLNDKPQSTFNDTLFADVPKKDLIIKGNTPTLSGAETASIKREIAELDRKIGAFGDEGVSGKEVGDFWRKELGVRPGDDDMVKLAEKAGPYQLRDVSIKDLIQSDPYLAKEVQNGKSMTNVLTSDASGKPAIIDENGVLDGYHRIAAEYRNNPNGTVKAYISDKNTLSTPNPAKQALIDRRTRRQAELDGGNGVAMSIDKRTPKPTSETPLYKSNRLHQEKLTKNNLTQNEYAGLHQDVTDLENLVSQRKTAAFQALDNAPKTSDGKLTPAGQVQVKSAADIWTKAANDHLTALNKVRVIDGEIPIVLYKPVNTPPKIVQNKPVPSPPKPAVTAAPKPLKPINVPEKSVPVKKQLPTVKQPNESKLNTNRLNTSDTNKAQLDKDTTEIIGKLSNKDVETAAKGAGIDTKTHTIDQTKKIIAQQLNVRKDAVRLSNEAETARKAGDTTKTAELIKQAAEQGRVSRSQGTDIARQLQARKIIANELDTPQHRIFRLLDEAGINPDVYSKRLAEVDFANSKQVVKAYRELVPAKAVDWLDTLRYNSMLSSPLTQAVNIFGNAQNIAIVAPIEKTLRGTIDAVGGLFGKERQYAASEGTAYAGGAARNIVKASNEFVDALRGTGKYSNPDFEAFNIPLAQGGVKGATYNTLSAPMRVLDGMDKFFRALADGGEEAALTARSKAGIKIKGNREAIIEAEKDYRVFQTELGTPGQGTINDAFDEFAKLVMKARGSKNPLISLPAKFTVPFVKTVNNINKQGVVDYSPIGFLNLKGNADKTTAITRAIMGSAVFGSSAALIAQGQMTWAEPRNADERARFRAEGRQPYAVKFGDKWVNFSKMTPSIAFPMAMTAALHDALENGKTDQSTVDKVIESVAKVGNFYSDQSYAKGIGDTLAAIGGDTEAIAQAGSNNIQQVVPFRALSGWIARITDDTERKVDTTAGYFDQQVQALMQQYPGLRQKTNTRDYKGLPIAANNQVFNGISPVRITKDRGVNPVDKALDDSKKYEEETATAGLSKSDQAELKKLKQAQVSAGQKNLIATEDFAAMTPEQRTKALNKVSNSVGRDVTTEYKNSKGITTTKSSGSKSEVNDKTSDYTKKVLNEYNTLDAETKKSKAYKENSYDFKVAQAKYDNDKVSGKLSTVQDINRKQAVEKAKVGKDYSKDIREAYSGLTSSEVYAYASTDPDGNRIVEKLLEYGDKLAEATGEKNKFRNKNGSVNIAAKSSGGSGSRGGKAKKQLPYKNATNVSSRIALSRKLKTATIRAKSIGGRKRQLAVKTYKAPKLYRKVA